MLSVSSFLISVHFLLSLCCLVISLNSWKILLQISSLWLYFLVNFLLLRNNFLFLTVDMVILLVSIWITCVFLNYLLVAGPCQGRGLNLPGFSAWSIFCCFWERQFLCFPCLFSQLPQCFLLYWIPFTGVFCVCY